MNKYKKLLGNTTIFFVSQFASKVVTFLLLPLYTSYMSTEEFALAELVTTMISLLLPILSLSLSSAVLRFVMDNANNASSALYISNRVFTAGLVILIFLYPLINYINIFPNVEWIFIFSFFTTGYESLYNGYTRAVGKIKLIGIVGVFKTIITVILNIYFLVIIDLGVKGYLLALALANLIAIGIYFYSNLNFKGERLLKLDERKLQHEMLCYSIPLIPNSISWWIISSFNRYVINGVCGASVLGLFSAASRLPSILITIQNIVGEAMVLSIIEEYDNERDVNYFTNLYNLYNFIMVCICSLLILLMEWIAGFLLSKDFFQAWIYVPFLLIATVFGALSGYLGNFYSACKKNNGMFLSTLLGGGISCILYCFAIKPFGVLGATMVNIVAYVVIWGYRYVEINKNICLKIHLIRDIITYILLFVQAVIMVFSRSRNLAYGGNITVFIFILFLFKNEIKMLLRFMHNFTDCKKQS